MYGTLLTVTVKPVRYLNIVYTQIVPLARARLEQSGKYCQVICGI